ncbi:MAG: glycine cleavage system protein GcvH [Deltaproteobacteria bacterium]|nr:glycine cleavage system protein GcvH [Deltaproteobacteria bacterium]
MAQAKSFPENLLYTRDHEWCSIAGDIATVGITFHAQEQLGDIVYCELPKVGASVSAGQTFGVVESTKAVSDLFAPMSGEVLERNEDVVKNPESLNEDSYGKGWMLKVRLSHPSEADGLLTPAAYLQFLEAEG